MTTTVSTKPKQLKGCYKITGDIEALDQQIKRAVTLNPRTSSSTPIVMRINEGDSERELSVRIQKETSPRAKIYAGTLWMLGHEILDVTIDLSVGKVCVNIWDKDVP